MKFEILRKSKNGTYFHAKKCSATLLNALRRTINASLPSFAIQEVTFSENSSALFNEYIAHRLGLIPLKSDADASPDLKPMFSLDATGPTVVYSKDLKSTDEKVSPALLHVPVISLGENQSIRLEATAVMGTAKRHAKFQNAHASFSPFPQLKITGSKTEALKLVPRGAVDENGKVIHPEKLDIDILSDNASITPVEGEFILYVESFNGEEPADVLRRAVEVLEGKAGEFKTALK